MRSSLCFDRLPAARRAIRAAGVVWLATLSVPVGAQVPNPLVTGPIPSLAAPGDPSRSYIFFASQLDLASRGYVEEEYFISGTANRYVGPVPGPLSMRRG